MRLYEREDILRLCEKSITPAGTWIGRSAPDYHEQCALCYLYLRASCQFTVRIADYVGWRFKHGDFLEVSILRPTFQSQENGEAGEAGTFLIPTDHLIDSHPGEDWA